MPPARFRQADISLVKINNAKSMSPAVSSGRSAGSFPEQRLVIEPKVNSTEIDSRRDIYTGFLANTDESHGYKQAGELSQLQTLN